MSAVEITVVTCIESGRLEEEVLLMLRSLRQFGGRLADCPVLTVTPRVGPPLLRSTHRELRRLGARHIRKLWPHSYGYNGFMNKPWSVAVASEHASTEHLVWLDGDMLIVSEPTALLESAQLDAMACVEEMGPFSTGQDDKFDSFWTAAAGALKSDICKVPWVMLPFSNRKARIYFNSGIFRLRRNIGFEQAYLKNFQALLNARIVPKDDPSIFLHEQICFSLTVGLRGLNYQELPSEYNYHVEPVYESFYPPSNDAKAIVLHYHRALLGSSRRILLERLRRTHPHIEELITSNSESVSHRRFAWRAANSALSRYRARRERWLSASCARV